MGKKDRQRKQAEAPEAPLPEESAMSGPQPKFGQALASNDKEVRDKAVKSLENYLKSAQDISEVEVRKIWKALFYCFWHSDKPKVQADLADRLASIIHVMSPNKAWLFAKVFWATMTREWGGIDRLRLDKFYMLMRRCLAQQLRRVGRAKWAIDEAQALAAVLGDEDGPLAPEGPTGIKYFISDNFLPILKEAVAASAGGAGRGDGPATGDDEYTSLLPDDAFIAMLEPFVALLGFAADDGVLQRAVDGVVQPLLAGDEGEGEGEEDSDDDDAVAAAAAAPTERLPRPLRVLAERLFDVASERSTRDRNRKLLYALQQRVEGVATQLDAAESARATALAAASGASASKAKGRKRAAADAGGARATEPPAADPAKVSALRNLLSKPKKGAKVSKASTKATVADDDASDDEAEPTPSVRKKAAATKKRRKADA